VSTGGALPESGTAVVELPWQVPALIGFSPHIFAALDAGDAIDEIRETNNVGWPTFSIDIVNSAGIHMVGFDAGSFSRGVYFNRLAGAGVVSLRKLIVMNQHQLTSFQGGRHQAPPLGTRQKEIDPPIRTDSIARGVSEGNGQFICSRSA